MTIKILNLYAGIGGNRKLWDGDIEVTAVEIDPQIAKIYQDFFPKDKVIVVDAHQYLLEHFGEYDFIWSSPPCPTHSRIRNIAGVGCGQNKPIYPDMSLYQEIIFLNQCYHTSGTNWKGVWCVENVVGYYEPLIKPQYLANHYFWANFEIGKLPNRGRSHMENISGLEKRKCFNLKEYEHKDKIKILRNCTEPEVGLHIFNSAFNLKQTTL
jgi:DNA (cytosine-5)-methyltransferase 1